MVDHRAVLQIDDTAHGVEQVAVHVEFFGQYGHLMLCLFKHGGLACRRSCLGTMLVVRIAILVKVFIQRHPRDHIIDHELYLAFVIINPLASVPVQPTLGNVAIKEILTVIVYDALGVAGIVKRVPLARFGGSVSDGDGVLLVRRVNRRAILARALDGQRAVSAAALSAIPLLAHQPGGAEEPVHLHRISPCPKGKAIAQRHICLTLAVVIALPIAIIKIDKQLAIARRARLL